MKHLTLISLLVLTAFSLPLGAQNTDTDAAVAEESSSLPYVGALERAQQTISEVDAQFDERQNEVLADAGNTAVEDPEEVTVSQVPAAEPEAAEANEGESDAAGEGAIEATGDQAMIESGEGESATDESAVDEAVTGEPTAADEPVIELPETENSSEIAVGEVYMDFEEEERSASVSREADTISIDFPNEDVRTIIRNVADLYELNVVIPDTLVGSVSLKLRDVTWRQVFDVILEPLNFTWIEEGNIIKIRSLDELMAEPVATHVFVINFAQAEELQSSIAPLIDTAAGGRIQVNTRSNALVITERPSRMNDIQAIIERLDRPSDQVMIESKFVEITRRDTQNLGINWTSLNGYEMSAGPFEREYTAEGGSESIDTSTFREGTVFDPIRGEFATDFEDSTETSRIDTDTESRLDTAVFSADAFSVILSALESKNDVELVSNPTVVTMNNAPAQINIGEEYPIPSYTYNQEQGSFEVSGFEYKPIGIILNVTPQVNSAGFINLNIAPEISSRTDEVSFGGAAGAEIPIITTRKTESTVTIKSGYTLAIGGLMQTRTDNNSSKVPLLGDIPLLGRLFKGKTDELETRNLIIFITAKVLNPDGSTYRDVFSEETLYQMGISDRDIPGYELGDEEQALYDRVRRQRDAIEAAKDRKELQRQLELLDRLREPEDTPPPASDPDDAAEPTRPPRFGR